MSALSEQTVARDMKKASFLRGAARGRWKVVRFQFPELFIEVAAVDPQGNATSYSFRFLLDGYPNLAPDVRCWDIQANTVLPPPARPQAPHPQRTLEAFKEWGHGVYRPWDRHGATHNNWAYTHPDLAWHSERDLTFILEDLYELLNAFVKKAAA
jgi:hypothetical protein